MPPKNLFPQDLRSMIGAICNSGYITIKGELYAARDSWHLHSRMLLLYLRIQPPLGALVRYSLEVK